MQSLKQISRKVFLGIGIGVLGINAASAAVRDLSSEQLVERLQALHEFSADFTQSVVLQKGATPEISSGSVNILDHQVRWQVDKPQQQVYITHGQTLWQIDFFLEQVIIRPLSQKISSAPILLLSGDSQALSEDFTISEPKEGWFILLPKNPNEGVHQVVLVFHAHQLQSLQLEGSLGETTLLTFTDVNTHTKINPELFTVNIPSGFDVVDERTR